MKPSAKSRCTCPCLVVALLAFWLGDVRPVAAQSISVTSTNPSSTAQGTVNLDVTVNGKGFKKGAAAKWFVTGTTNPGGVTVNSSAFVNSGQLTANITVASDATISGYDVVVANAGTNGGSGKGTDLFSVIQGDPKPTCTVQPLPSGISFLGSLNYVTSSGTGAYGPFWGVGVRARQMVLGGVSVLVVAVSTPGLSQPGGLEIFFLDPVSGQLLDGTVIGTNTVVQPHISLIFNGGGGQIAAGDVNGDGIPDFATVLTETGTATAVVGSVTNGIVSYQAYPLSLPSGASGFGYGVAMGNLAHSNNDIAVTALGGGSGPHATPNQVALYTWNGSGFTNYLNIPDPQPSSKSDDKFGNGIAIADVTGGTAKDLIVGASNSTVTVNGTSYSGRVYVFPGPVTATNYFSITDTAATNFGLKVAAGDIYGDASADGYMDLLVSAYLTAPVFNGPVSSGQSSSFLLQPVTGLDGNWPLQTDPDVSDVNGDGLADVLIGASNATSGSICGGVAYLWLSAAGSPLATQLVLSTPVPNPGQFGYAEAFAPGTRLFLVTDHNLTVGSTSNAGQVYVYKVN